MTASIRLGVISVIALSLSACGGGGSDSGTGGGGSSPVTSSTIIKNAKDYSPARLNTAASSISHSQYKCKTTNSEYYF